MLCKLMWFTLITVWICACTQQAEVGLHLGITALLPKHCSIAATFDHSCKCMPVCILQATYMLYSYPVP